jgi:hypothetical protein
MDLRSHRFGWHGHQSSLVSNFLIFFDVIVVIDKVFPIRGSLRQISGHILLDNMLGDHLSLGVILEFVTNVHGRWETSN